MLNTINPKCLRNSARSLWDQQAVKSRAQHHPLFHRTGPGLRWDAWSLAMGTVLQESSGSPAGPARAPGQAPLTHSSPPCLRSLGYSCSHSAQPWAGVTVAPEPQTAGSSCGARKHSQGAGSFGTALARDSCERC